MSIFTQKVSDVIGYGNSCRIYGSEWDLKLHYGYVYWSAQNMTETPISFRKSVNSNTEFIGHYQGKQFSQKT